ncbi:carboxylate-amine ligase [Leucobacter luti]|uniref:carboxylate-amine ligase n=1 Tax=Leucobacter luti TaxID=340320 RepID=UPI0014051114|nr:YbdK family carboxylate-amine ligase [Leucobacter luti]MCW2287086.1 carboxylate-amine ligase [Leucobacter luti]
MSSEQPRMLGIEEEFVLLDEEAGTPVPGSAAALINELTTRTPVEHEFLDSQVETATPPCSSAAEAEDSLRKMRTRASKLAQAHGLVLAATGTPPRMPAHAERGHVTPNERYLAIASDVRKIAQSHYINGLHVHVSIHDRAEGIRALNGLGRWAPLLLAMTSNSPFWDGADTGFQSWRHVIGCAWPLNTFPAHFTSADDYDMRVDRLLRSGLILDRGLVSWTARLSSRYPTIELRVADAQLAPSHSVGFALIVRALVDTLSAEPETPGDPAALSPPALLAEEVNLSMWTAARDGLQRVLVDPQPCQEIASSEWIDELFTVIEPALARTGDAEQVGQYLDHLRVAGTPADVQRRTFEHEGIPGLSRLYRASHHDDGW